jgi:hypothetical protein
MRVHLLPVRRSVALLSGALALSAGFAAGGALAAPAPEEAVGFQLSSPPQVPRGGESEFAIVLQVAEGYAVLSSHLREPGLTAAAVTVRGGKSVTVGKPRFPKGRLFKVDKKRLNAYEGDVTLRIPIAVSRSLGPGLRQLEGTLTYQVCTATGCFEPVRRPLALQFEVTE